MRNESLISIDQLCNDNCITIFSKTDLNILTHHDHTFSFIVHKTRLNYKLAQYLDACAGSPVISTF